MVKKLDNVCCRKAEEKGGARRIRISIYETIETLIAFTHTKISVEEVIGRRVLANIFNDILKVVCWLNLATRPADLDINGDIAESVGVHVILP
jgi:hypothetical protein